MTKVRSWMIAAMLAAIIAYLPALRAPYVFDDISAIPGNASIRQLSTSMSPPPNTAVSGRPAVNYTFAVNYWINDRLGVDQRATPNGRNKTLGFHLVNLLLHIACGLLIFCLLRDVLRVCLDGPMAFDADNLAVAVAALWLLHPVQSEAVNYLVQRTELLVSFCYLATIYSASRAWRAQSPWRWYTVAVVACLLGMLSKEVMFTAPVALAIFDRIFYSRSWAAMWHDGKRVAFYGLLALTSVVVVAAAMAGTRAGTAGLHSGISVPAYVYSQAWAITHYLRLIVIPAGLTFDYGAAPVVGMRGMPGAIVLAAIAGATVIAWTRLEKRRWVAFAGSWFFLTLAPSSSIVPISTEIAAERRVYLALVSVLIMIVLGADHLVRRHERLRRWGLRVAVMTCMLFTALTFLRSVTYASSERLWRDAMEKVPGNPRAYHSLATELVYEDPPRLFEAETLLREAIRRDSLYAPAWSSLAAVLADLNRSGDAEAALARVLAIDPGNDDATALLGRLLLRRGNAAGAIPYLEGHARAFPSDDAFVSLGTAYLMAGRGDDGYAALREALRLNPARVDAMRTLGGALAEQGRAADAVPILEAAVRTDSLSALSQALLSYALARLGNRNEASRHAAIAAANANGSASVFILAGRAEFALGNSSVAETYFAEALQLRPDNQEARAWMARARASHR